MTTKGNDAFKIPYFNNYLRKKNCLKILTAMPARQTRTGKSTNSIAPAMRRQSIRMVSSFDSESCFVSSTPAATGSSSALLAITSPILSEDEGGQQWVSGADVVFKTPKAPSPVYTRRRTTMVNFHNRLANETKDGALFRSPPGVKTRSRRASVYVPVSKRAEELKSKKLGSRGVSKRGAAKIDDVQLSPKKVELSLSEEDTNVGTTSIPGKKLTKLKTKAVRESIESVEQVKAENPEQEKSPKSAGIKRKRGSNQKSSNEVDAGSDSKPSVLVGNLEDMVATPAKSKAVEKKAESSVKRSRRSTRFSMYDNKSFKEDIVPVTPKINTPKNSPHPKKVLVALKSPEGENVKPASENENSQQENVECWLSPNQEAMSVDHTASKKRASRKSSISWKSPAPLNLGESFATPEMSTSCAQKLAGRQSTPWIKPRMAEVTNLESPQSLVNDPSNETVLDETVSMMEESQNEMSATISHTGYSMRCTIL